jgi:hypothetical protein
MSMNKMINKFFEVVSDAFEIGQLIFIIGLIGLMTLIGTGFAIAMAMVVAGIPLPM